MFAVFFCLLDDEEQIHVSVVMLKEQFNILGDISLTQRSVFYLYSQQQLRQQPVSSVQRETVETAARSVQR